MDERRKAKRWYPEGNNVAHFIPDGMQEKVLLGDITPFGMKAFFPRPVSVGTQLQGKVEFSFNLTGAKIPFHIKGEVVRVNESNGRWDTAIKILGLMNSMRPA
ncbi:MAG: PilZ domain-containing protein [Minisyncoccota bacterium]